MFFLLMIAGLWAELQHLCMSPCVQVVLHHDGTCTALCLVVPDLNVSNKQRCQIICQNIVSAVLPACYLW